MSTKAAFITAMGGSLLPFGRKQTFVRSSGDILTAVAHGLQTGAGPYKMTNTNGDAPSGLTRAVHSSTFMTGTSMVVTDVLIVDGKSYTLIATPANDGDVDLGATDAETAMNLTHAINQEVQVAASTYDVDMSPNPDVRAIPLSSGASGAVAVLRLEARTLDASVGDLITVSSVDGTMAVDNATMENGADGADLFIIRLDDDTFSFATSKDNALAGTAITLSDAGTGVNFLVPTTDTLAEALEDVVTNVLTANGARSMDATFNTAKFWRASIDGVHSDLV